MFQGIRTFFWICGIIATIAGLFASIPDWFDRVEPLPVRQEVFSNAVVVDLHDHVGNDGLHRIERLSGLDFTWVSQEYGIAIADTTDPNYIDLLLTGHPLVEDVEPYMVYEALGYPNDPLYEKQWHMDAMGAPVGWATTPRGKGIVVAVLDTGVTQVEDLKGTKILEGKSFIAGESTEDGNGHGTHCAGTIAQTTNNGIGLTGVAPEASILPVKVLSNYGSGSNAGIAAGIRWAADNGADVISMSLGGSQYSDLMQSAIDYALDKGVVVIAAAGNSGGPHKHYPACNEGVVGVSAIGPDGKLAPYSTYGDCVDVAAPGGNKQIAGGGVWQGTVIDGKPGYYEFQGTSMATPHVAGAVAVLLSTGMEKASVEDVMYQTADGDGEWNEEFGWGKLDLKQALAHSGDTAGWKKTLFALAVTLMGMLTFSGHYTYKWHTVAMAVFASSGLFFLPWLGLTDYLALRMLSDGILHWPAYLVGQTWGYNLIWLSPLLPLLVTALFAPSPQFRWIPAGLCFGLGTHMIFGALMGTLSLSLGAFLTFPWLLLSGAVCIYFGLAISGLEKRGR